SPAVRLPSLLVGSPQPPTAPGVLRLWNVGGGLFSEQALFNEPTPGGPPAGIDTVFLTWSDRRGQGATPWAALRDLLPAARGDRPTLGNHARPARERRPPTGDRALEGWAIALVHGNGPQVGDELARNELAADQVEPLPLGVLVAATAGWMGYMIQQSLQNALARVGVERQVVTLVTQTLCDANDPNLRIPTKPIGHALDATRVARLLARGVPVVEE